VMSDQCVPRRCSGDVGKRNGIGGHTPTLVRPSFRRSK
jgi:hypothetical protein